MKGVYVLVLELDNDADIQIGKLGMRHFKKGFYAYIGSAQGEGGFKRVTRHFDLAEGKNKTRKWHIDHLLPRSKAVYAVLLPTDEDIECTVAIALGDFTGIPGFGCTDCSCPAHLFFSEKDPEDKIIEICSKLAESLIIRPHIYEQT